MEKTSLIDADLVSEHTFQASDGVRRSGRDEALSIWEAISCWPFFREAAIVHLAGDFLQHGEAQHNVSVRNSSRLTGRFQKHAHFFRDRIDRGVDTVCAC